MLGCLGWHDPQVVLKEAKGLHASVPQRFHSPPVVEGSVVPTFDALECFLHESVGHIPVQIVCTRGTAIMAQW